MHPWYYRHNQGKNIYRNKDIHYLQKFPYVSLLSFSFSSPFLKITQRATEWCCSLRSHLTTSVVYRCPTTLLASFRYASTPLFLFLHFLKQSASIWRFIRDSFLSLADSKPPIYNDKNAEENSGGIKFWIGKTLSHSSLCAAQPSLCLSPPNYCTPFSAFPTESCVSNFLQLQEQLLLPPPFPHSWLSSCPAQKIYLAGQQKRKK